jgi:hypothetical protein
MAESVMDASTRRATLFSSTSQRPMNFTHISETVKTLASFEHVIPPTTKLNERVHTLVNHFLIIGDYYVSQCIAKAIALDTADHDSLTTSMVDDIFYLVKSTLQRGMATRDPDCFCALVNSISKTLEVEFMSMLLGRLSSVFANQSIQSEESRLPSLALILNNIDTSCNYINRLCSQIEQDLEQVFSSSTVLAREKIKSCLSNLTDYSAKTLQILKTWIENYYNQTIKPKIRGMVGALVLEAKYTPTDEDYSIWEATQSDFVPRKFHGQFQRLTASHVKNLTESNLSYLVQLILAAMLREWESRIMQLKFSFLGAMKLDKEIRDTLTLCLGHSPHTRDLFSRLTQISLVLGFEQPKEVLEVWGNRSGSIRWRLSALDVKKTLALRIEFAPGMIAALTL